MKKTKFVFKCQVCTTQPCGGDDIAQCPACGDARRWCNRCVRLMRCPDCGEPPPAQEPPAGATAVGPHYYPVPHAVLS
jgi:hypothetical protein